MGAILKLPRSEIYDVSILEKLKSKWRKEEVYANPGWASDEVTSALLINRLLYFEDFNEHEAVEGVLNQETSSSFHLIILPHEDCNFRCTYCYETFERGKMSRGVVDGLKAFSEIDLLSGQRGITVFNVSWFGGEPCLALDIVDELSSHFTQLCEKSGINYRSGMTTNGFFLNKATMDRLTKNRVSHFQVTLDGPSRTHDLSRRRRGGQGTFDVIYNNLKAINKSDIKSTFTIRVNVSPDNYLDVPELIGMFAKDFQGDERFSLDFHGVGHWGGPHDDGYQILDGGTAFDVCLKLTMQACEAGLAPEPQKRVLCSHGSVCYAGKENSVVVGSDGTLYKCTVAFSDERNKVGQLKQNGELLIDSSKWQRWVGRTAGQTKCTTCSFMPSCQGKSCPLEALDKDEPPCPMTELQLSEMVRFAVAFGGRS
ncbi:radical SAM/SPASM domain-containing protein [Neorhizobium sp. T25_27]|uniref:radical SAM/SPASM domain-containing protein n=1 Tax=Neorhizobium sp. T25_27 TaxID=2093831 RepID=UPI00155DDF11|nr:radical SAM protein [Neorhizobium sp. T25_27]